MKRLTFFLLFILLAACSPSTSQNQISTATLFESGETIAPSHTFTPLPSDTPTYTPTSTPTVTPTFTDTFTPTLPPTDTLIPTETLTPSVTSTPTFAFPTFMVTMQAHCRYGPSKAYLHAADLYAGDTGLVWGRFPYSLWLYVKLDKLNYPCWVSPSVVEVTGDTMTLAYQEVFLPGPSVLYGPPKNVSATRQGNQVTITWSEVWMTEDDDNGYFIEAFVCQNGLYIWFTVGDGTLTDYHHTTYTLTDELGCLWPSKGQLYAVEKHGYTTPVTIPWP